MMDWTSPLVPLSVFIASLMGSTHCIGMCTPFVLASSQSGLKGVVAYHIARLLGYILLALPFYFLIQTFSNLSYWTHLISAFLMGGLLLFIGIQVLKGKSFHGANNKLSLKIFGKLSKLKNTPLKSALIGLLTPLLPCGWLYAFLAVAVTQPSQGMSFVFIVIFWLGTLPALSVVSFLGQQSFQRFQGKKRLALGLLLIAFGTLTLIHRTQHIFQSPEKLKQILCL